MCFQIGPKHLLSGGHCLREVFQTLCGYILSQGLSSHTRFDEVELTSSSQVHRNHKLQIVFGFLSTIVEWCMVAAHFKKIKHIMLCVWCVCKRYN